MPVRHPLSFDPIAEAARNWSAAGWDDVSTGMAFVTSIMRAQQILLARVDEVLRPHGLTFARFEALMLLSFTRTGALPMGKIGQRLQVHPASVTNAIDRLEAHGLVERSPHPGDGRGTLATITEAGRRCARAAADDLNRQVFGQVGLTDDTMRSVVAALAELRRADFRAAESPSHTSG